MEPFILGRTTQFDRSGNALWGRAPTGPSRLQSPPKSSRNFRLERFSVVPRAPRKVRRVRQMAFCPAQKTQTNTWSSLRWMSHAPNPSGQAMKLLAGAIVCDDLSTSMGTAGRPRVFWVSRVSAVDATVGKAAQSGDDAIYFEVGLGRARGSLSTLNRADARASRTSRKQMHVTFRKSCFSQRGSANAFRRTTTPHSTSSNANVDPGQKLQNS